MKIKFLGQNCFLFTYKGKNILTDPFYNFQKEKSGFDIVAQKIDYVLITHAHGDHIADVKEVLQHYPEASVIGQPEICGYFAHPNSIDINFGGSAKVEDLKISMVPASHTSSFPDGTYGGEPCGYIFRYPGKNIYFSGDTGVMADMEMFPKLFGKIDLAILPVGSHYTMCARKASFAAAELLKAKKVIGCHFDTFPPITINHEKAHRLFAEKNIEFTLPKLGEEFEIE
ncbi:metal-dependent hydrolase [Kaistella antarctica]|uniref:Beta-lactamase n=1 Tax=Kaistella antarctica TaxID=266748 RepID=A0A448NPL3_9FLAO|nr:metal-dependent hydrolase [Kaistella antarctica]KEY19440.1 beta-lactamase [Kaistella antarctica]SEW07044.1 L-ascorbate metabolism protein UlaG, beta-lactamase superfamily [Kaistella antarctica]VEH97473.1 metal-dependent hydrolase [Kaistella antarctica]